MVIALMVILTRSKIYPLLSQNEVNVVTKATKKAVGQKDNAHSILWRYRYGRFLMIIIVMMAVAMIMAMSGN